MLASRRRLERLHDERFDLFIGDRSAPVQYVIAPVFNVHALSAAGFREVIREEVAPMVVGAVIDNVGDSGDAMRRAVR